MTLQQTVLLTDRAWPDDSIERGVLEDAGFRLVAGPADPAPAEHHRRTGRRTPARRDPHLLGDRVRRRPSPPPPPLRVVARMGVGLDNIDVAAATDRGVLVTNVPDYCVEEVSDHAVGLVLAWTRGLVTADREVRAGRWNPAGARLRRLSALTCGVVGYGRIGRATAAKLQALGARVVISDPHPPADTGGAAVMALDEPAGRQRRRGPARSPGPADPSPDRRHGNWPCMPQGAFLINVSRGGLVDTAALIGSPAVGHLGGAGLDVLEEEPSVPAELLAHPGVIVTPHIAFSSDASVIDLRRSAAEEVVRVLRGEPARYPCNTPSALATGVSS